VAKPAAADKPEYDGTDLSDFRMLPKHEVIELSGLSYATLWAMMQKGTFPRSRQCAGRVMWLRHEIKDWLMNRPVQKLKGDPGPVPTTGRRRRKKTVAA
jgi:predicted DNA-binding transcriptional regulator AlpA